MDQLLTVLALTLVAGAAIPLGAAIASWENLQPQWLEQEFRHSVVAFGGGALLAAVALVLVPEGTRLMSLGGVTLWLTLGGLAFMALDILLDRLHSPAAQLTAMMSDFLPEAMALGAAFATGDSAGPLLALLIALQNLPEGFNSYRELRDGGGFSTQTILLTFCGLTLLGPLAGWAGLFWLADWPTAKGAIMLAASGGILYLTFQDIAPQAKLEKHWAPAMSSVLGFLFGVLGQMVIGH